jgi:uncharacterized membrane protein YphA (DoxX/SURF4 family)
VSSRKQKPPWWEKARVVTAFYHAEAFVSLPKSAPSRIIRVKAGLLKYHSFEFAVKLFQEEYRVPLIDPAVAARLAMMQELTIPILLFLGLATRIATIPLLGMIAVIQTFVYPNAYNDHLVWGSILVLVLTRGPGIFSLDYVIERAVGQRRAKRETATRSGTVQPGTSVTKLTGNMGDTLVAFRVLEEGLW